MLADCDASVRAEAATVVGAYGETDRSRRARDARDDRCGRVRAPQCSVGARQDRLDRIDASARRRALSDKSGLVSGYAKAALANLK